jgi:predicted enzyme related to lactoylglutathione lyase
MDLTVPDAAGVRDFYRAVVGWSTSDVDMGGYSDYCMHPVEGEPPVAGICHARGANAGLPACWLVYLTVTDLERSLRECVERGGSVVAEPRSAGQSRFAVISDPAGAVAALFQP